MSRLKQTTKANRNTDQLTFGYVNSNVDPLSAVKYGVLAEKMGFKKLWLPDHLIDVDGEKLEPWTILSAVAVKTRHIGLASSVTDTQRTHPARTAQIVACLDCLSKGRAILGIGAGEAMNVVPFGLPWESPSDRIARLEEAVQVVRLLWSSSRDNTVNFNGNFFKLENAFLSQSPVQKPTPPIYIGAFSAREALTLAGEYGDGWHSWINTADTFRKRWSIVKSAAEYVGRNWRKIDTSSHLLLAFPRNGAEQKKALLIGKATLLMEKSVLRSVGYTSELDHYQRTMVLKEDVRKIMAAAERLSDELVYKSMAIGDVDTVKEKVDELAAVGVRHFALCDLLAPTNAKGMLKLSSKIIKDYS